MVVLSSQPFNPHWQCPPFKLPSVDGRIYSLADFKDNEALLVAFICNHCPYVKAIESRLIELAKRYQKRGVATIGICSNDPTNYPDDSKEALLLRWQEKDYGFPYLIDENQSVAKAFDAVCTPDLFLFDAKRELFYHGRLDDNWKEEHKVTRHDLSDAIEDLLAGKKPPKDQISSMGCSIKWKK